MTITPEELRKAMRNWASGITIVTVEHEGVQHGMTVSSFTSLSLDPPLISVSLYDTSRTHTLVSAAGKFGVTILTKDQEDVSNRFAGRIADSEDRFADLNTETLASSIPFITGGLTFFECRVTQTIPMGTNTLFVGEIVASKAQEDGDPLLYFNQKYGKVG
ncbi:MAG: flavin reductase family protein [Anaerolineae bacterium]|jgi:flavin reductase (DIM6/NTAB) family NADH-FMN oxidoreductase RutF|nr:flavin reductase family protein [Anaerolineae bacterium]MBT7070435.1 flavin reductase family protein [Anaerolineae bacterium]MBT7990626.1 flavin reductase family protein [Anaerolineae bacterium]